MLIVVLLLFCFIQLTVMFGVGEMEKDEHEGKSLTQSAFDDQFGFDIVAPSRNRRKMKSTNPILGFFPILQWLPKYNVKENLVNDIIGGLTVGIMHVPQGMAYSSLAGLRPVNGLYTSLFPAIIYMIFGTSRHVSLGVFAVVSLLVGSCNLRVTDLLMEGLNEDEFDNSTALSGIENELYYTTSIRVVTSLTLLVGIIQIAMALLRLDFLTSFLSDQIIKGFTTGAAVHVFVAQLNKIIGVTLPRHSGFGKMYFIMADLVSSIMNGETNWFTFGLSLVVIVILFTLKTYVDPILKKKCRIPMPYELFIMILGTALSGVFNLHDRFGVKTIGVIPTGLPMPVVPDVSIFPYFIKDALAIAVVAVVVTISMGKLFARKHEYEIDVRQEFYALGFMETFCSLFPVWPASTALARTLVYEAAGTKTQLATVFSSGLLLAVIFFIGPLLEVLPMCFLSCIIIVALKGMFLQLECIPRLWRSSQADCAIFLVTMCLTVVVDVVEGLLLGVLFSLAIIIQRILTAHSVELGQVTGEHKYFLPISEYGESVPVAGVVIVQFPSSLVFLNVENFKKSCDKFVTEAMGKVDYNGKAVESDVCMQMEGVKDGKRPKYVLIDFSKINYVDYSGAQCLAEMFKEYETMDLVVLFVAVPGHARKMMLTIPLFTTIADNFYPSIEDALFSIKAY